MKVRRYFRTSGSGLAGALMSPRQVETVSALVALAWCLTFTADFETVLGHSALPRTTFQATSLSFHLINKTHFSIQFLVVVALRLPESLLVNTSGAQSPSINLVFAPLLSRQPQGLVGAAPLKTLTRSENSPTCRCSSRVDARRKANSGVSSTSLHKPHLPDTLARTML
jgi:hypothetical protein